MTQERFIRDYELIIQVGQQVVSIRPPIQIVFTVDKSTAGGLNRMSLQVFNLKESNRLAIVKDEDEVKRIPIELRVGYQAGIETIFKGTIHKCSNDGDLPNFISTIEAYDGGFDGFAGFTSRAVRDRDSLVNGLIQDLPNTAKGKITTQQPLLRPKVLVGNTVNLLRENAGADEDFFIDSETVNIIKKDEAISNFVPVVTARTGLMNTPERESQRVTFDTMMNPTLKIGGLCEIRSRNAPHLNDVYKIESMVYSGDYEGQDWSQNVSALAGNYGVV